MRKKQKKNFKIIFIVIAIICFFVGCSKKNNDADNKIEPAKQSDGLMNYYTLHIIFDNAAGLEEQSPVIIDSETSGYVESFDFIKDKVKTTVKIKKGSIVYEDADITIDYKKSDSADTGILKKTVKIKNPDKNSIPLQNNSVIIGKTPQEELAELKPRFLL
ncbi:MAG TPA: MlaD family protein [bacterium]|nr:MlaD family protein [bacterium]HPN29412.1 MlaD family protein [bacterium]